MTKAKWAIWSYSVGFPNNGGFILGSIGCPYRELKSIARQMNSNGEGQRYVVRRHS